jgi:hypothetical protein
VSELEGRAALEEVGLIDSEIILPWAVWWFVAGIGLARSLGSSDGC